MTFNIPTYGRHACRVHGSALSPPSACHVQGHAYQLAPSAPASHSAAVPEPRPSAQAATQQHSSCVASARCQTTPHLGAPISRARPCHNGGMQVAMHPAAGHAGQRVHGGIVRAYDLARVCPSPCRGRVSSYAAVGMSLCSKSRPPARYLAAQVCRHPVESKLALTSSCRRRLRDCCPASDCTAD